MKLMEINIKRYAVDAKTSVVISGNFPSVGEEGNWHFYEPGFEVTIKGKFGDAVKKATKDHKRMKGSSFSHTLTVEKAHS